MILPARLQDCFNEQSIYGIPEKILRHVISILMHILIRFGIKNDRFI